MKFHQVILAVVLLFLGKQGVLGQNFANLNFEMASVQSAPPGFPWDAYDPISAASALPYWTAMEDGIVCNAVWGYPQALDETSVGLVSTGSHLSFPPIDGNYSVYLSCYANPVIYTNSSISQTGLIPDGTKSIQFKIENPYPPNSPYPGVTMNPVVTLNGTPITLFGISNSGGVETIVGDVSAFAGSTATLEFLCQANPGQVFPGDENNFILDDIQFSASPVPEPATLGLSVLGGLLLAWRRSEK